MKPDDLMEWLARARKEPAPAYEYDETGIGFRALQKMKPPPWLEQREQCLRQEWYEELDDEIPF